MIVLLFLLTNRTHPFWYNLIISKWSAEITDKVVKIVKLDLSFTITAIIALCALITPLLTTKVNNSHQIKLKQLELRQQSIKQEIDYVRNKIDIYLQTVGAYIGAETIETQSAFEEAHFSLLPILPMDLIPVFEDFYNMLIVDHQLEKSRIALHQAIVPNLKNMKMGQSEESE